MNLATLMLLSFLSENCWAGAFFLAATHDVSFFRLLTCLLCCI